MSSASAAAPSRRCHWLRNLYALSVFAHMTRRYGSGGGTRKVTTFCVLEALCPGKVEGFAMRTATGALAKEGIMAVRAARNTRGDMHPISGESTTGIPKRNKGM